MSQQKARIPPLYQQDYKALFGMLVQKLSCRKDPERWYVNKEGLQTREVVYMPPLFSILYYFVNFLCFGQPLGRMLIYLTHTISPFMSTLH